MPISLFIPSESDTHTSDFTFPSTVDNEFPDMAKTSKAAGGGRRGPRTPRDSLLGAQTVIESDVEDHQRNNLFFTADRPIARARSIPK